MDGHPLVGRCVAAMRSLWVVALLACVVSGRASALLHDLETDAEVQGW